MNTQSIDHFKDEKALLSFPLSQNIFIKEDMENIKRYCGYPGQEEVLHVALLLPNVCHEESVFKFEH